MIFVTVDAFYKYAASAERLTRDEERELAALMLQGSEQARERIVNSYLCFIAARMKKIFPEHQTLELLLICIKTLEDLVAKFNFLQDNEPFSHRLTLALINVTNAYMA